MPPNSALVFRPRNKTEEEKLKVFQELDKNNNGLLDRDEVESLVSTIRAREKVGFSLTQDAVDKLIARVDKNKDGQLTPFEFMALTVHLEDTAKDEIKWNRVTGTLPVT